MTGKKHSEHGSEEKDEMKNDEEKGDVIATIHVLKNKEHVKKRVVTRHNKHD